MKLYATIRRPIMLCRRFLLLVLTATLFAVGCSDDESQQEADEAPNWTHEDLDGPAGGAYDYRGRIGDAHYFVGDAYDQVPGWYMPAQIYATSGWSRGQFPLRAWWIFDRSGFVVEAGGAHYVQNARAGDGGGELFRSDDSGQSWQLVGDLPSRSTRLQTDGQALFLVGGIPDNPEEEANWHLLRSTDGGESWETVRDGLASHAYSAVGGWVAAPTSGGGDAAPTYEISEDGGDSWQQPGAGFDGIATAQPNWRSVDGAYLTYSTTAANHIGVWSAAGEFHWYQIAGIPGSVHDLAISGDDIYVASDTGALGRLSTPPSEWPESGPPSFESVLLPDGQQLENPAPEIFSSHVERAEPNRRSTIFGFSDGSLGALTAEGMWHTSNGGQEWEHAGQTSASIDFLIERSDTLIAGTPGRYFERGAEDGAWEPMDVPDELEDAILVEAGGDLFGVHAQHVGGDIRVPTVYAVDLAQGSAEQLWSDEEAGAALNLSDMARPASAQLLEVDGELFVGSGGNLRAVISSERRTTLPLAGGGLFRLDLESGQAQHLTADFPGHGLPMIQAMVAFDGLIWAVTTTQGVFTFDPADGSAERAHSGLPTDDTGEEAKVARLIKGLVVHKGTLYAFSSMGIFYRDENRWRELEAEDFYAEAGFDGLDPIDNALDANAIIDVEVHDDDRLLVASLDGVYTLAPDTGEFTRAEIDFDAPVYKLFATAGTTAYLSLWQGGLHRIAPAE